MKLNQEEISQVLDLLYREVDGWQKKEVEDVDLHIKAGILAQYYELISKFEREKLFTQIQG